MHIRVIYDYCRVFCLDVEPHYSVRQLKLMLQYMDDIGVPTFAQCLRHRATYANIGVSHSTVSFPPEEELALSYYGVKEGSCILLSKACCCLFYDVCVQLTVGRIDDIINLRVADDDTTYSVKRLIHEQTRIDIDRQHLSLDGKSLEDRAKLVDCGIAKYTALDLRLDEN